MAINWMGFWAGRLELVERFNFLCTSGGICVIRKESRTILLDKLIQCVTTQHEFNKNSFSSQSTCIYWYIDPIDENCPEIIGISND